MLSRESAIGYCVVLSVSGEVDDFYSRIARVPSALTATDFFGDGNIIVVVVVFDQGSMVALLFLDSEVLIFDLGSARVTRT